MAKATFKWDDPFLFNEQLTDEERMIRDAARKFCYKARFIKKG